MQAYHIVLTTHNSRSSDRMREFKVKRGVAIELTLEQEINLTKIIADIFIINKFKCIAYNICRDHVHLILVCAHQELSKIIGIVKGKSAFVYNRECNPERKGKLWSNRFFRADLDVWKLESKNTNGYNSKDSYLDTALAYVQGNREKHGLPHSAELNELISSFVMNIDEAFSEK